MKDLEKLLHQKTAIRNLLFKLHEDKEKLDQQLKDVNKQIEELNDNKQGKLF